MQLWTAFILGFVGSLHCAGMCGPLALALPVVGSTHASFISSRLLYNLGRLVSYASLGALFGLAGKAISLAGFQRWLSIGTGVIILCGVFFATGKIKLPALRLIGVLKFSFASLLRERSYSALFSLGMVNGLLPCGLVYVAATASIALGNPTESIEYMIAFGLGTWPVMLGIGLAGKIVRVNFNYRRLIPATISLVAVFLILRGLSLGIPYLSPTLSAGGVGCAACK